MYCIAVSDFLVTGRIVKVVVAWLEVSLYAKCISASKYGSKIEVVSHGRGLSIIMGGGRTHGMYIILDGEE